MEQKTLTLGEEVVGITFNPSEDSRVSKIKETAAKFIDAIDECGKDLQGPMAADVLNNSITKALEAQMMAVKALFLKV